MAAASALDGSDAFRHGRSVLLARRVRARLLVGLGEFLPHPTHVVARGRRQVLRPRLCGSAGRTDSWCPGTAGEPCLAAASAFVQCEYVHMHNFTRT